ncbi:crotonase/enoyl-CoA hydratase family protein [soil metagenome]
MEHVRYDVRDHTAVVTLDRPQQLNAFTDTMERELITCFDLADADPDVRAVVLTGSGRAFCAGMDLGWGEPATTFERWRASDDAPAGTRFDVPGEPFPVRRDGGGRVVLRMFDSTKPLIAAINVHAVGVGITMTLAADIRVAAEGAKIAFPFTRRAFVPESCSSWFLPRIVGVSTALEWLLTGRTFASEAGLAAGLFRSLHPAGEVLATALALASEISAEAAPVSASLTRQMVWRMLTVDHPMTAHEVETLALNRRGVSSDAHEGVAAFLEHRTPTFSESVGPDTADCLGALPTPRYRPPGVPLAP